MLNPGDLFQSGSHRELRGHVLQRLHAAKINDHVFEVVEAAFSCALVEESVVLSRVEKRRLLADVLKSVLEEMDAKLA
ncbi:MAG TPA: hypothetical protein VF784_14475 [Anaerolineales bacterium]